MVAFWLLLHSYFSSAFVWMIFFFFEWRERKPCSRALNLVFAKSVKEKNNFLLLEGVCFDRLFFLCWQ